jgi:hypothetical protein
VLQVRLTAGGNGVAGMDMQVGDGLHEFFTLPQIRGRYHWTVRPTINPAARQDSRKIQNFRGLKNLALIWGRLLDLES